MLNLTELLGFAIGWMQLQAMFVAAMLMVSSSAVIAKIVAEQGLSHERSSQPALAVTVLEDVVAMLTIHGRRADWRASNAASSTQSMRKPRRLAEAAVLPRQVPV
ncbi:MAG: hypothetical protein PHE83_07645 [Opitutaceae bacterium]|nr:hypothetical protein [Opitutaceae bacterium]